MFNMLKLLDSMIFYPRYGPEWGSGGIFGLKYYKGTLYFTLAFEAVAYFIHSENIVKYTYNLIGSPPRSGGDTYNAVEVVDEHIYFGGWVHAPAIYMGRGGAGAQISFKNKFSHVHSYNVYENKVELLWKEGLHHETEWVGEISEIVYDPINDRLLLARGDGMTNLGVYQIDRKGGNYRRLSEVPAQKGVYFHDHICFDMFKDWVDGIEGIQCIDLIEDRVKYVKLNDIAKRSVDGGDALNKITGVSISAYGRYFLFVRGGLFVGNPLDEMIEPISFYRLFDFGYSGYGPRRTMAKPLGGGILVAFNSYSEAIIKPVNEYEALVAKATNTIVGPSVLLYITPPIAKIVAALGARITGFELVEDKIVLACNNMANTFRYDASPIDAGYRSFIILPQNIIFKDPPPIRFNIRGFQVSNRIFGGIPLTGYKDPLLKIYSSKSNKLHIYEYDLSLPPTSAIHDMFVISKGLNVIELKGYRSSVISIKLEDEDPQALIRIDLS